MNRLATLCCRIATAALLLAACESDTETSDSRQRTDPPLTDASSERDAAGDTGVADTGDDAEADLGDGEVDEDTAADDVEAEDISDTADNDTDDDATTDAEQETDTDADDDTADVPDAGEDVPDANDAGEDVPDANDAGEDVPDANDDTGPAVGRVLCETVARTPLPPRGLGTNPGAPSPYPGVYSPNVVLGALDDPSVVESATAGWAVRTTEDLTSVTYDVYVPAGYDGSEPYGLISFINSGNDGGGPSTAYRDQLESERLIYIAPDGAGNSVNVDIRMGRSYLGTLRAMELFNIDETRIYTSGNSGGGRTSNMLMYQYPELYTAAIPRCGANYPREVDQDYETREPDSHYEFWGSGYFPDVDGRPYIEYLRSLERRFALLVSYDDFREGDIMNIYHNGMEEDGLFARMIQTTGAHCATSADHFRDGLGFAEHPLFEVVADAFEDGALAENGEAGSGVIPVTGIVTETGGRLRLAGTFAPAAALLADRMAWYDRHGLILRSDILLPDGPGGPGTATLSIRPYDAAIHSVDPTTAPVGTAAGPGIHLTLSRVGDTGTVSVTIESEAGAETEVLTATFDDWPASSAPADLKIELWDRELQIDLGWHLLAPTSTAAGARLLDDRRTIRTRWDELNGGSPWSEALWSDGAVVTFSVENGDAAFDNITARDGAGFVCEE